MTQLLAHLVGDYLLQSNQMAQKKTGSWKWALYHATTYTLPFLFITQNPIKLIIICLSHAIIDRYRLAKYYIKFRNNSWNTESGYPAEMPAWMSVWLMIIIDNVIHLLINYLIINS